MRRTSKLGALLASQVFEREITERNLFAAYADSISEIVTIVPVFVPVTIVPVAVETEGEVITIDPVEFQARVSRIKVLFTPGKIFFPVFVI